MSYEKLEYNPTVSGLLIDKYPDLEKYVEFKGKLGDKLLRFCILYFDEESPFYKNRDLDDRKNKCYEAAKADLEVRNEVEGNGSRFVQIALRWFKLHNTYVFEEWISRKMDFHENNSYLSMSLASFGDMEKAIQRKTEIKKNLETDRAALLNLENSLFKDEKSRQLLTKAVNEANLGSYAERNARNFFEDLENQR